MHILQKSLCQGGKIQATFAKAQQMRGESLKYLS